MSPSSILHPQIYNEIKNLLFISIQSVMPVLINKMPVVQINLPEFLGLAGPGQGVTPCWVLILIMIWDKILILEEKTNSNEIIYLVFHMTKYALNVSWKQQTILFLKFCHRFHVDPTSKLKIFSKYRTYIKFPIETTSWPLFLLNPLELAKVCEI